MSHVDFATWSKSGMPSSSSKSRISQHIEELKPIFVGAAVVAYGSFINTAIDFVIVAFCIFMVMKGINAPKRC